MFETYVVGSLPRPRWVRDLIEDRKSGAVSWDDASRLLDRAVPSAIAMQRRAGVDYVSDGEWRRESYVKVFADAVGGFGYDLHTEESGIRVSALPYPAVVGRLDPRRPIAADEARFLRAHDAGPIIVAIPSLRLKALYVAITTLALHFGVTAAFAVYLARVIRSEGILIDPPHFGFFELYDAAPWYYFLLAIAAVVVIGALNLQRSHLGRRWVAVADHEVASSALGISIYRAKLSVFVITSMLVSFAGCLGAYYEGVVTEGFYDLHLAIAYLAMIIVGGLGSVLGSILGAFLITLLPYGLDFLLKTGGIEISAGSISGMHSVLYGLLIVGFMLFEPLGLAEIWRRVRDYFML